MGFLEIPNIDTVRLIQLFTAECPSGIVIFIMFSIYKCSRTPKLYSQHRYSLLLYIAASWLSGSAFRCQSLVRQQRLLRHQAACPAFPNHRERSVCPTHRRRYRRRPSQWCHRNGGNHSDRPGRDKCVPSAHSVVRATDWCFDRSYRDNNHQKQYQINYIYSLTSLCKPVRKPSLNHSLQIKLMQCSQ